MGLVCALVAWALAGAAGLVAGVVAALLIVAFFSSGAVPIFLAGQTGLGRGPGVGLLLLTYTLRLVLLFAALALAAQSDLVDGRSLGITLIVCALAWSALQLGTVLGRDRNT